ncbi:phosphatidylinositol glycan anchor biosynthesis class U protein [Daphnia magna]|uniref:Phosphatidylinositol glycan anchor biosynthesis class U protein n=1 Tax=Daphnia magna TaxID=35525 RepID=A0A0P5UC41_9CRUS|nr:phosphatidylinositol glycan anchor biosynthesis class U protein [Daphnia magna]KZS16662.1 Phosphatidylinositol glycan anchor biosynthesis class U protein [Daphnia magna]
MYSPWKSNILGVVIRAWMFNSGFYESLSDRVEISTPLNSWKRVVEGVYLHQRSQSPYEGDVFHETPTGLLFYTYLLKLNCNVLQAVFILCDVITAIVLTKATRLFIQDIVKDQQNKLKTYHKDAKTITLKKEEVANVPQYVTAAYLLNPYIVCSCVAMTTTVFANLILSLTLFAMAKRSRLLSTCCLALASHQSFYPVMLLVPIAIATAKEKQLLKSVFLTITSYALFTSLLIWFSYLSTGSWRFIESTYGCILKVPDLTPNIGLFWYFFTEMFDHFYLFFTYVFQLNPFIYVIPLAIRFDDNVPLLSFTLCAIMAIFKSYPSIGDVGFYLALLPLWNHLVPFFRHSFIVGCIFLVTSVLSPILWYLWIYTGSANANFFFATTLAFATAQIFLLTDVLFAQAKYDYHLKHGVDLKINGKDGMLVLE